jgi:hypothetical protein
MPIRVDPIGGVMTIFAHAGVRSHLDAKSRPKGGSAPTESGEPELEHDRFGVGASITPATPLATTGSPLDGGSGPGAVSELAKLKSLADEHFDLRDDADRAAH